MNKKKFLSLLLALCMSFVLCVPAFALETEWVEIKVNSEQDILDFFSSDEFDSHAAYRFVYPDSPIVTRALCPKCGYNTLVGKTVEKYDECHPRSQGQSVHCLDSIVAMDFFRVMLVYAYQYCNTCGYKSSDTFVESKFYIDCTAQETSFVATDYKTAHPEASRDWHEWKTSWVDYYNDPHY